MLWRILNQVTIHFIDTHTCNKHLMKFITTCCHYIYNRIKNDKIKRKEGRISDNKNISNELERKLKKKKCAEMYKETVLIYLNIVNSLYTTIIHIKYLSLLYIPYIFTLQTKVMHSHTFCYR
jgi:hypothetical protein